MLPSGGLSNICKEPSQANASAVCWRNNGKGILVGWKATIRKLRGMGTDTSQLVTRIPYHVRSRNRYPPIEHPQSLTTVISVNVSVRLPPYSDVLACVAYLSGKRTFLASCNRHYPYGNTHNRKGQEGVASPLHCPPSSTAPKQIRADQSDHDQGGGNELRFHGIVRVSRSQY